MPPIASGPILARMSKVSASLVRDLKRIVGEDGIVENPASRATYECDGYTLERAVPDLVVLPRSPEEVARTLERMLSRGSPRVEDEDESPYAGLLPFDERRAGLFFGSVNTATTFSFSRALSKALSLFLPCKLTTRTLLQGSLMRAKAAATDEMLG